MDHTGVRETARQDDDDRSRAGLLFLVGLLIVLLIGAAASLLPKLFESPPEQERVPDLIGLSEERARLAIGDAGLRVGEVTYRADEQVRRDRVLEQDPNPDQFVDPDSEVDLVVSTGKPLTEVPYVIGDTRSEARDTLEGADLEVIMTERESDEPQDQVVDTDPAPGASVPEGSTVTVYYSDGPEQVPDVVGMQQDRAERVLTEAGFEVDVLETTDTTEPRGTVVRQSPAAGQPASDGSTVTIVVSSFEEPSESPSPTETPDPTDSPSLPTETPETPPSSDRSAAAYLQRSGWA